MCGNYGRGQRSAARGTINDRTVKRHKRLEFTNLERTFSSGGGGGGGGITTSKIFATLESTFSTSPSGSWIERNEDSDEILDERPLSLEDIYRRNE